MQRDMQLDGKTRKQFHDALLSAFPTPAKLKQMVSFELNENLDAIATGENYSEVVFKLIEWAKAEGKIKKLLDAARSSNPGNPKLKSFDEQIRNTVFTTPASIPTKNSPTLIGKWKTYWYSEEIPTEMEIFSTEKQNTLIGKYSFLYDDNHEIEGQIIGSFLDNGKCIHGTFVDRTGSGPCKFYISKDGNRFDGVWLDANNNYILWVGERILGGNSKYDVALSFAGEERDLAERLANALRQRNINVFYDRFEESKLWGKNLFDYLSNLYENEAHFCVMFLSKHYARKDWTRLERQSAQSRAFKQNEEYILPLRIDDTPIPGILETISYLDFQNPSQEDYKRVADNVVKKLKAIE